MKRGGRFVGVAYIILEGVFLASALSVDAFIASFAYGSSGIIIPFSSVCIVSFLCSAVLGLSLLIGSAVRQYMSEGLTAGICFAVLFILGIAKFLDGVTKSIIRKHSDIKRNIRFSLLNFSFVLSVYANPEAVDVDRSKTISGAEAASLSISLSLDGLAVGFGAALGNVNGWAVFLFSLMTNALAVIFGAYIGHSIAKKLPFGISWLGGIILIALSIIKLLL